MAFNTETRLRNGNLGMWLAGVVGLLAVIGAIAWSASGPEIRKQPSEVRSDQPQTPPAP